VYAISRRVKLGVDAPGSGVLRTGEGGMRNTWLIPGRTIAAAAALTAFGACSGHRPESAPQPQGQVNVGYDRIDADDATGSISSLAAEDLELVRASRIEELIRDRVPGVLVTRLRNGDYSLRIRGTRSLIGNNEPLVVIDGMAVPGQVMQMALAGVSPADVVRIDVLKDAGSTAAFGSRGANGVIIITTRAGGSD
jgi:TonB-dependent SusC/RagA subfamily outer membrane receptor